MTDQTYQKFVKRWKEVTDLPPQHVGIFTPVFKWFAYRTKNTPWHILVLASIGMVCVLYYLIGSSITWVASLLQRGF